MFTARLDLSAFHLGVARSLDELEIGLHNAAMHAAHAGEAEAKAGTFKDRTHQLRRSIAAHLVRSSTNSSLWELVAPMPYAAFVEYGTASHDIYPKAGYNLKGPVRQGQTRRATGKGPHEYIVGRGLALRWRDSAGNVHFARMVHHPGSRPFHFMAAAEIVAEHVLYEDIYRVMRSVQHVWQQAA